ncbi:hypothetical protein [Micromonospora auratinigra]|uniref:Uncharacterized protein n=1 Tax=Micromonospora auratinigra TaxID=261654 RepID=A0A1A8ZBQ7_9ACTN|nr:hypothetical protein [Micromonospora auratinigra]SBT41411.1 hypothetical protein GA0070611_1610 [Micromonospora auratinigra]
MTHNPTQPRAYITAPTQAAAALAAALAAAAAALAAAGFLVTPATAAETVDADDLVAVVAEDMDAARAADAVVTLPGAEGLPEGVYAALYAVPVVTLAEVLGGAA